MTTLHPPAMPILGTEQTAMWVSRALVSFVPSAVHPQTRAPKWGDSRHQDEGYSLTQPIRQQSSQKLFPSQGA